MTTKIRIPQGTNQRVNINIEQHLHLSHLKLYVASFNQRIQNNLTFLTATHTYAQSVGLAVCAFIIIVCVNVCRLYASEYAYRRYIYL